MRIGKFLIVGLLTVAVLWGAIIFKAMDMGDFLSNTLDRPNIITAEGNHYLGEKKAGEMMESKVYGANLFSIELGSDGTRAIYTGSLQKGNTEYTIVMNAKTGEIISLDSKYITSDIVENNQDNSQGNSAVNTEQASDTKSTNTTKSASYSDKQSSASSKQSSTSSKQNTSSTKSSSTSNYISRTKATKIMLNKAPGARVISLRRDGSRYEGILKKGDTRYEITLSAKTGKVLDFDRDYDYYDDDRYDDDDDEDEDDDDEDDDD